MGQMRGGRHWRLIGLNDSSPAGPILHIPDPYQSIIATARDIITRGMELDTSDRLGVSLKAQDTGRSDTDVPHLDRLIF